MNVNGTLKYNNASHNVSILGNTRVYIPIIEDIDKPVKVNNG